MTSELDIKRQRIEKTVKYVALPVVAFFVAPFIFIAIKGLIGLVIAAAVSVIAVNLIPWFSAKVANFGLKMLKAEASRNPIETLQNDWRKRKAALNDFEAAVRQFIAEKESYSSKLDGFKSQYPSEAAKFAQQLQSMEQLLTLRKRKLKEAHQSLDLYDAEIKKADAIWQMGQAAAQMSKAAGMTDQDFFAKIQVETALNSVQKNMSMAFADLEMSLLDEQPADKVTPLPSREQITAPKQAVKTPIS